MTTKLIDIMNQHVAVLGKTGSGKTYAAKGLVERGLMQGRQTCIIDPTGAWWGLRHGADGKSKGFQVVILGGEHGDLPLAPGSGAAVARLVTEQRPPCVVIDTSGMSVGEYTRWFTDFAGVLFSTIRQPLQLVIDEAHHFMPQGKVPDPQAGRMLHAGNRLMSGGRSRGIRGMLITQRPAKLHKDSLTCADALIAMRVIAPQDRAAIKEWVDGAGDAKDAKQVLDSLANLQRGEGWVWFPEGGMLERMTFGKISTWDSSATPGHGGRTSVAPAAVEIDLSAVKAAMEEAVKEAEANDPRKLREEVARLRKELAAKPDGMEPGQLTRMVINAKAAAKQERDQYWLGQLAKMKDCLKQGPELVARIHGVMNHVVSDIEALESGAVPVPEEFTRKPVMVQRSEIVQQAPRVFLEHELREVRREPLDMKAGESLPKGERIVLTAIAQHGDSGCSREQLTILTGYKRSSRDTYLQRLRERGYIGSDDDGNFCATAGGVEALGDDFELLPVGDALRMHWKQKLTGGELVIFNVVCEAYPAAVTRTELSERTDYQRSSRDTYVQRLAARRLVTVSKAGVTAARMLFG